MKEEVRGCAREGFGDFGDIEEGYKGQARVQALKELRQLVTAHSSAKNTVVDNGGIALISSLLGSFYFHTLLGPNQLGPLSIWTSVLSPRQINCTKLIEVLMEGKDFESEIASSLSLVVGLLRLVKDKRPLQRGGCLDSVCSRQFAHTSRSGTRLFRRPVRSLHCQYCGLFASSPQMECASIAVEASLAAKLLLVIQSGCNPVLKQRAAELLKLCSLNYLLLLQFISKWKLTRTIQ
ncbi:hypothetical protein M0R45_011838 [Rubus argutus]|uniref:U-box domain-containing protein n=1 Tax=Rubus argutus TaxID=59490 RepID=A0AAW1YB59_RUBAR